MLQLGKHQHYKNQTLWLRLDSPDLRETTASTVKHTTYILQKKYGEPGFILPPHTRFLAHLDEQRLEIMEENRCWLQENPTHLHAIADYHCNKTYAIIPHLDVDAALYQNGFPSTHDQRLCQQFHQLPVAEKATLIPKFQSHTLQEQAIRVLGRYYPEQLSPAYQQLFQHYMEKINSARPNTALIDYRKKRRRTPKTTLQEIATIKERNNLDKEQLALLNQLAQYIHRYFKTDTCFAVECDAQRKESE